ncbi:hypothetical protein ACFX16_028661 [Malus domestica]
MTAELVRRYRLLVILITLKCCSGKFKFTLSGHPSRRQPSDSLTVLEEDALEKLMIRRSLLLVEDGWSRQHMIEIFLARTGEEEADDPSSVGHVVKDARFFMCSSIPTRNFLILAGRQTNWLID